jgi:hypothetical protein
MGIFRLAAELFLIYMLYKLIFEFIIPLYQSAKKLRRQFGEMQSKMQQDMNGYEKREKAAEPEPRVKKDGEYIEFEEVK